MPLVGDRVRLASRPHRSLRRLLRRRLFASAPPPSTSRPCTRPAPRAGRYRRALQVVTRRIPSLCTRPRRPPPSPPLVATLIAAAAIAAMIFPFAPSRYAAHNGVRNVIFSLENGRFEAKRNYESLAGLRPAPRDKMTFRLGARPDLRITRQRDVPVALDPHDHRKMRRLSLLVPRPRLSRQSRRDALLLLLRSAPTSGHLLTANPHLLKPRSAHSSSRASHCPDLRRHPRIARTSFVATAPLLPLKTAHVVCGM